MGGGAHLLALAGYLAVHGLQEPPLAGLEARSFGGPDARHRRAAGQRRRARRPAGSDPADGQPQGHLPHRRDAGRASWGLHPASQSAAVGPALPVLERTAVRRFPRSPGCDCRAHQRDGRGRRDGPSRADSGSGRGDFGLRGSDGVSLARGQRALGGRSRRDAASRIPEEARRPSRGDRGGGAPHWLVVPGAPHRPARRRAAAHAHHASAGHHRRLPLAAGGAETRPREARHDARPHRLPEPLAACRAAGSAGDLVAAAHDSAPPAPPRVPARPASWSASRTARRRRRRRPGG